MPQGLSRNHGAFHLNQLVRLRPVEPLTEQGGLLEPRNIRRELSIFEGIGPGDLTEAARDGREFPFLAGPFMGGFEPMGAEFVEFEFRGIAARAGLPERNFAFETLRRGSDDAERRD